MYSGNELRQKFVQFFQENGHTHVASSPLLPAGDPTLLFANAGMNQFKDVFLGLEQRPYRRAVTYQKCVRAGGKHNDLDAVGRTARHHTFFEMLGNFSFGDYFKREAIAYGWQFLTEWAGLPADQLYATIYENDDEAFTLWCEVVGLPPERIVRLGEKDNFWAMGDTGPCGPCSEILIDRGAEHACGPQCAIGVCDCDRWREIWNLVFMQYNRDAAGALTPLEKPGVDTGMGLERLASVVQGVYSNYDTDLLRPLITRIEAMSGKSYDPGPAGLAFRVIADHARACTFLLADGVRFAGEGRGYVMRRILRRAVRYGRTLGFTEPFLHQVTPAVVELMRDAYPEVAEHQRLIVEEIRRDEERFFLTLEQGMRRLDEILAEMAAEQRSEIRGDDAFLLYDTFGFPLDIVQDVAWERGLGVDERGFEACMAEQRRRARAAHKVEYGAERLTTLAGVLVAVPATVFVGADTLQAEAQVLAVLSPDGQGTGAGPGDRVLVVLDRTPFYAEAGGQVGDTGLLSAAGLILRVEDTQKLPAGHYLHDATVESGQIERGMAVTAAVDEQRRRAIMQNHTATHLLHKALRLVLGDHVQQAGSLVAPERLRFDITQPTPLSAADIGAVEELVNDQISRATPVQWFETALKEARALGAMALFGEKYGDVVRVVRIGDFSLELCGGTHLSNVAGIGLFKIVAESGIGSGVRRIEAVTGRQALAHVHRLDDALAAVGSLLGCPPEAVVERVEELQEQLRRTGRELERLQAKLARAAAEQLLGQVTRVGEVPVVAAEVQAPGVDELRAMTDFLRDKLQSGVVVLAAVSDGRVQLVAAATKDLTARGVHAGNLVRAVARAVGGGGGGRPDMAQAGGKNPAAVPGALAQVPELVAAQLRVDA